MVCLCAHGLFYGLCFHVSWGQCIKLCFFHILLRIFECQSEEELVYQVDKDVRKMLIKPDASTPETLGVRVWPRAIPQFEVGHLDILSDARNALANAGLEGIFLGGNYVSGVALGRCVESAYEFAESISQFSRKVLSVNN